MIENLHSKIAEMEYDGLISGTQPRPMVFGGVIAAQDAPTTFKRGTVFGKNEDGKLEVLGTDGCIAYCILCDDVTVEASTETPVAVYVHGCFNTEKLIVKDSYEITAADKENLQMRGIFLKGMLQY